MEKLIIVVLDNENFDGVALDYFPENIRTNDRANWEAQDTTIGVKPLFYANREPRRLEIEEAWLDSTDTGESLTPKILDLRRLFEETKNGVPSILLVAWGQNRDEEVVLEELTIEEVYFSEENEPLRCRVSLSFIKIQFETRTNSSVRIVD